MFVKNCWSLCAKKSQIFFQDEESYHLSQTVGFDATCRNQSQAMQGTPRMVILSGIYVNGKLALPPRLEEDSEQIY